MRFNVGITTAESITVHKNISPVAYVYTANIIDFRNEIPLIPFHTREWTENK